jgi:flavin-dependent dehydrogenase
MHNLATTLGVETIHDTVTQCHYAEGCMEVSTRSGLELTSELVIGAFGKRSLLDKKLERDHLKEDASYLAVKAHFKGEFPDDLVALHNFKGGYCGISRVEEDLINVCYITEYSAFKPHKDIENFQEQVMHQNPHLREFFHQARPVFEEPLAISQISFADKERVNDHVLMCGDSAGLIHPLCGNGMSMAIRGAKLLSEAILSTDLTNESHRHYLEERYSSIWKQAFSARLNRGRQLAKVFSSDHAAQLMLLGLRILPGVLPRIISSTHGRPMTPISL